WIEVNLRGAVTATPFVTNIDYNAKDQRTRIEYGILDAQGKSRVKTDYEYERETFRLIHLKTTRTGVPQAESLLQDLHYTYDPAGNITHIRDDAQQTIYFRNRKVEPSSDYTYDAVYRLVAATGREHLGQAANGSLLPPTASSQTDAPRIGLL